MSLRLFKPPFDRHLFFDGAMGTMLQQNGLKPGELPETWNVLHPEVIVDIHRQYLLAGADVITANTFGANPLKYGDEGEFALERIVRAGIQNVKAAIALAALPGKTPLAALDIGPLGRLLEPYGDLPFEEAVSAFAKVVRIGVDAGADLILIETMNDSLETKAAVLAAKENSDLPVIVTNTYDASGKMMTGADASVMVAMLEGLRVDALGVNCGEGPQALLPTIQKLCSLSSLPVLASPNAGLPQTRDGKLVYDLDEAGFARQMEAIAQAGASFLGGCCGTTPSYIAALTARLVDHTPKPVTKKTQTVVSSNVHVVALEGAPVLIGERINPTGRSKLKKALRENDMDYLIDEALDQQDSGAQMLDVNVGVPGLDEKALLRQAVFELQSLVNLPLQLDSANPHALEAAMRIYNGKPMVNSVNGKASSMAAVFPLVQKYGGVVIALTLDEDGIPQTAQGRVDIAKRILDEAAKYGIEPKDIVVDPLAMAVSADPDAGRITLEALRLLKQQLGVKTSLGVSNVSFGLPGREMLSASFFLLAMENGLNAAILNPASQDMQKVYHSFLVLHHLDDQCVRYIDFAQTLPKPGKVQTMPTAPAPKEDGSGEESALVTAIVRGMGDQAHALAVQLVGETPPLEVIDRHIIPALDRVGKGFERKKVFLPQLLMSADAAGRAFEAVWAAMPVTDSAKKCPFVLATVQGDIHDIGKNIVRVLLENYGYEVIDLGYDVSPRDVVDAVLKTGAPLAGLSALMTTTVPAMEETVRLLKAEAPGCKVVVGGAVLTQDVADAMGADCYSRDAMETVRYAERVWNEMAR